MARPVVSAAAERVYARIPAYHKNESNDSDWILLHLCEAAVRTVAKLNEALRYDDSGSGWRRMTDPDRCPSWALDWLRQFVGLNRFPPDFTEQQKRDMIRDAPNFRRGSRQMIRHAASLHLTGDRRVIFTERYGGSRHYRTAVFAEEVVDQQRVLDELRRQKPATFLWDHDFLTGEGWADVDAVHADWAEVLADFTDWQHVMTDPLHT